MDALITDLIRKAGLGLKKKKSRTENDVLSELESFDQQSRDKLSTIEVNSQTA